MYVISGKYRHRKIDTIANKNLRPTMGVVREAVFNILTHGVFAKEHRIEGASVLELFCGSGAFSMEAFSRGAAKAVLIDIDDQHLAIAKRNITKISQQNNAIFLRADSTNPPKAKMPCDIIFIDPPYYSGHVEKTLTRLADTGWIKPNAIIVLETASDEKIELPSGYEILLERRYGKCSIRILKHVLTPTSAQSESTEA